jgi:hypothetical protein
VAIAAAVIIAAVLVRFYLPGPWPWRHGPPAAPAIPGAGRFYLGVDSSGGTLTAYDAAAGVNQPAVFGAYTNGEDGSVAQVLGYSKDLSGTIPMVSWGVNLQDGAITDGSQDAYLRAQAKAVVTYKKPVFIRLDWEMNGSWYPEWSQPAVSPSAYIAAWRHIWTIFHQAGATNAAFVWCPNVGELGGTAWTAWYPGSAYVDWVGLDAYPESSSLTADVSGTGGLDALAQFAEQSGKPAMLAEWAPGDPTQDPEATFDAVFAWAARYPDAVKALVYFNFGSPQRDDLLADDPTGAARMRQLVEQDKADIDGIGRVE